MRSILYSSKTEEKSQASVLGRQLYPFKGEAFINPVEDAPRAPFRDMVMNLLPETQEEYRLRTNIFPNDPSPGRRCQYNSEFMKQY